MRKNNKGFSLIELSIVLIIMGLLIAGVSSGASLIKSAQLRSVATEVSSYRTAYNTYYAQFGKVPGADDSSDPTVISSGAWSALSDEGIIDKKPTVVTEEGSNKEYVDSKFGKSSRWYLKNAGTSFTVSDFASMNVLILSGEIDFSKGVLTASEAGQIDDKVDDGKANQGIVRGVKYAESTASTVSSYGTDNTTRDHSIVVKLDF
ncbi:MAG: prepilin-type N-terminal cleavage/methylation domain-containing protein [Rickettsiales bacterium]|nr:prepilin-type N-terminal cleavage/methylation domain-containing protein [Rickettsiales bacterium]